MVFIKYNNFLMMNIPKYDMIDLQPDEVWYIGDQYECDVKGSLNAGMLLVWYIGAIDLPYAENKNIFTAKTWSEIERYMEV